MHTEELDLGNGFTAWTSWGGTNEVTFASGGLSIGKGFLWPNAFLDICYSTLDNTFRSALEQQVREYNQKQLESQYTLEPEEAMTGSIAAEKVAYIRSQLAPPEMIPQFVCEDGTIYTTEDSADLHNLFSYVLSICEAEGRSKKDTLYMLMQAYETV